MEEVISQMKSQLFRMSLVAVSMTLALAQGVGPQVANASVIQRTVISAGSECPSFTQSSG